MDKARVAGTLNRAGIAAILYLGISYVIGIIFSNVRLSQYIDDYGLEYVQRNIISIQDEVNSTWEIGFLSCVAVLISLLVILLIFGLSSAKLWKLKRESMNIKVFGIAIAALLATQLIFSLLAPILEAFFNLFGVSILEQIVGATSVDNTVWMIIYAVLIGPVCEELVFRGILLNRLKQFGEKFAIILSAVLFGLIHANFAQSIFAFCLGLVFGYIASRYSIKWSIALHIFNNGVLGVLWEYFMPDIAGIETANRIYNAMTLIGFVVFLVYLIINRKRIKESFANDSYRRSGMAKACAKSPAVIAMVLISLAVAISTLTSLY